MNNLHTQYPFQARNGHFAIDETIDESRQFEAFGDIADPNSAWYNLRVAEMAGFDYVFVPEDLADVLEDRQSIEDFILHTQTLLSSDVDRTILITYTGGANSQFSRINTEWTGTYITRYTIESLHNSPQQDFITTLFSHSEKLVMTV